MWILCCHSHSLFKRYYKSRPFALLIGYGKRKSIKTFLAAYKDRLNSTEINSTFSRWTDLLLEQISTALLKDTTLPGSDFIQNDDFIPLEWFRDTFLTLNEKEF